MTSAARVAALYDIHGNLPALEAVLEELQREKVDLVVVGGDVVPGPFPRETLDRLLKLDPPAQFIYGNGETAVLDEAAGRQPRVPAHVRDIIRWTAEQLNGEEQELLGAWPKTLQVSLLDVGTVLFCHATPRDENEIFTRATPDERVAKMFSGVDVPVAVCGHSHMQFDRTVGATRIVNAGSVGMPFGQPGAFWLLLGPEIQLRRTEYDLEKAAAQIRATTYPQAEQFAASNVLKPPGEAEILAAFARAGAA